MTRRGQVVLLAAVLVAVALLALLLAYLQLGYHADVQASGPAPEPTDDATVALQRAVHDASAGVPATYRWREREAAVDAVRGDLAPRIDAIEQARIERGVARSVSYNRSLATRWADRNCPSGPARQFGSCVAVDGAVVQNRAGWTHVLAVAFDVRTTTRESRVAVTTVVRPVGDGGA